MDLERALTDLAGHLDYPAGDQGANALRRRLAAPDRGHSHWADRTPRRRALLVAAAVFMVIATSVVAIAPAREAVADWLGIGAVEIRRTERPPASGPAGSNVVPGATGATRDANAPAHLAAARTAVQFPIVTPSVALSGALFHVAVDQRVPGGLVALTYARFTIVEIATDPTDPPPLYKLLGAKTPTQQVTVNREPGLWIPSIHEVGYRDREGGFATDTVRRSGPVLLWQRAGVTYRIEGLRSLAAAQAVAASLR